MSDIDIAVPRQPGLLRLLVVNSYRMKGRIEELPLDQHTALLASNQAGKTSLLKLLPFFWGAQMRDIQQPGADLRGFIDFYLPTDCSYVACEFVNARGDVRSVVVHSDPSKQILQYRLVRGGLGSEMFLNRKEDGTVGFVRNADFENHAKKIGVTLHPRLITSTRDYRGIIQGRVPVGSGQDRSTLLGLIAEYGIGSTRTPLDNVDRLFLTMLDNKFSIPDLIGIVTTKVGGDDKMKVAVLGGGMSGEGLALGSTYRDWLKVMSYEPALRDAEAAEVRRKAFKDEIHHLGGCLAGAVEEARRQEETARSTIDGIKSTLAEEETRINAELARRIGETKGLRAEIDVANGTIKTVTRREDELVKIGADQAKVTAAGAGDTKAEIERLRETEAALSGNRAEIEARFSKIIDAIKDDYRSKAERIDERLLLIPDDIAAVERQLDEGGAEHVAQMKAAHGIAVAEIDEQISLIDELAAALMARLGAVAADPELTSEHQRRVAFLSEKKAELEAAVKAEASRRAEAKRARSDCEDRERELTTASSKTSFLKHRMEEIEQRLKPAEGSLHHWLERNRPDWRENIGLVISESLLARKDLAPADADGASLYGMQLNLSPLSGAMASIEALENEQASVFADIGVEEAKVEAAKSAMNASISGRARAMEALSKAEAVLEIATKNRDRAQEDELRARRAADASREDARQSILTEHKDCLERKRAAQSSRKATLERQARADRQALDDIATRKAEATAGLRSEAITLRNQKSGVIAERDAAVKSKQAECSKSIQDGGSDPQRIRELHDRLGILSVRLKEIEKAADLAHDWGKFVSDDIPKRDEARHTVQRLTQRLGDIDTETVSIKAEAERARNTTIASLTKIEEKQASLAKLVQQGEFRLEKTYGPNPPEAPMGQIGDPADIMSIIGDMDERGSDCRKAHEEVARNIRKLKSVFHTTRGKIRDGFDEHARRLDAVAEGPEWLSIFANWFEHDQRGILAEIHHLLQIVSSPIVTAERNMGDFENEISSASRRLRKAIKDLGNFPNVTDIDLSIKSRLRNEGFWADLQNFVKQWKRWEIERQTMDFGVLMEAFDTLMKNWTAGEVPIIDLKSMIYVEGSLREGMNLRRITKDTDISKLSSEGGSSIIRLVILTAAIHLIRDKSNTRFTWAVDEFGRLDRANSRHLLEMLTSNGVTLVTGAPYLDASLRKFFSNRIAINGIAKADSTTLVSYDPSGKSRVGIREWVTENELAYVEENA